MRRHLIIPLVCLSIISGHVHGQVLKVFDLALTQLPPVEYEALDSIALETSNFILLDTLVNMKGTDHYTIDWFVKQNGKYVSTQNLVEVTRDTSIYFLISYNETCTLFDSTHIQINTLALNTELFNQGGNIRIYPNPSVGKISINVQDLSGSIDICLFDLSGNKIFVRKVEIQNYNYTLDLDLYNIQSGIYIIEVASGNIRSYQKISLIK